MSSISIPVGQKLPLVFKFKIGVPHANESRAWLFTTNEHVFFPILANIERLESLVLRKWYVPYVLRGLLVGHYVTQDVDIEWVVRYIPSNKEYPMVFMAPFSAVGAKNPFTDARYEEQIKGKAFLIIVKENTRDPGTDEIFRIIRILKDVDVTTLQS